jgi:hypothetical protein
MPRAPLSSRARSSACGPRRILSWSQSARSWSSMRTGSPAAVSTRRRARGVQLHQGEQSMLRRPPGSRPCQGTAPGPAAAFGIGWRRGDGPRSPPSRTMRTRQGAYGDLSCAVIQLTSVALCEVNAAGREPHHQQNLAGILQRGADRGIPPRGESAAGVRAGLVAGDHLASAHGGSALLPRRTACSYVPACWRSRPGRLSGRTGLRTARSDA